MSARPERPRPDNWEPAKPDPGPGWLRSRFMNRPWPRPGHEAACGRASCPVCGPKAPVSEKPECTPIEPEARALSEDSDRPFTPNPPPEPQQIAPPTDDDIRTEEAISELRRYFHVYEGWNYITLRCGICGKMFGIKPNVPIMERGSLDWLMDHAKAHNETPTCALDYSRRYTEGGPPKGEVSR